MVAPGCANVSTVTERWRRAFDDSIVKPISDAEVGDVRSTFSKLFRPLKSSDVQNAQSYSAMTRGPYGLTPKKIAPNPVADAEIEKAEQLFRKGMFKESADAMRKIAKDRKDTPWGEKAQYYLAEIYFQQHKYRYAHDEILRLLHDYQNTKYMEKVVRREYEIAEIWFKNADPKTPANEKLPFSERFTGGLPIMDLNGYAIQALEKIQFSLPLDDMAPKALIRAADHYYETQNYGQASSSYDQLIGMYGKSPYVRRAELLSIDSKMKAYQGPQFDGAGLERARELVGHSIAQGLQPGGGNAEELMKTVDHINEAQAERAFERGKFYERTYKPRAAMYYYSKVTQIWPKSAYAQKAKHRLDELAKLPMDRQITKPSKIMAMPGAGPGGGVGASPMGMGGMGMGGMGMGGMGMPGMGMGGAPF